MVGRFRPRFQGYAENRITFIELDYLFEPGGERRCDSAPGCGVRLELLLLGDAVERASLAQWRVQMTATAPRHRRDRSHIAPVTSREELIYLLTRASELEHGLASIYLFAAYSLKNDVSEGGLTPAQSEMVRRWKRQLSSVAVEEMLHLAQVSNMLTAIGGAPHFKRANLPMPANAFPLAFVCRWSRFRKRRSSDLCATRCPRPAS